LFGLQLKRINVRFPFDVPKLRDGLTHYEADVLYENRIRYDYGIKGQVIIENGTVTPVDSIGDVMPRFAYIDIEVDNSHGGWTPDVAEGEILSMCILDIETKNLFVFLNTKLHPMRSNFLDFSPQLMEMYKSSNFTQYNVKIILCTSELDLLNKYKAYFNSKQCPDVLVAWNGWGYDYPYITARLKKNKLTEPKGIAYFDMMYGYGTLYRTQHGELESRSLQSCSHKELGTGKVELGEAIWSVYRNDITKFVFYNMVDVILMEELEKKIGVIKHYQVLSEVTGVPLDDINMSTRIVENMVFFLLRGTRTILPSRSEDMVGSEHRAVGGDVLEPSKGIFENVGVLDLKGEYPNIERSFNESPETIFTENDLQKLLSSGLTLAKDFFKLPFGNAYTLKTPRGVLPQILDKMMNLRDEMKKEMRKYSKGTREYETAFSKQEAFKWVMNSVTGVLDNINFRLANRLLFNNVTAMGRKELEWISLQAKQEGYTTLYGDTDSCLIQIPGTSPDEIIKKGLELTKKINDSFKEFIKQFNATESFIWIDFKQLYSKWFQGGTKKRYAGVIIWEGGKFIDPLIDITGFEAKRSSSAQWTRKIQKELLWRLLTEDKKNVEKFLRDTYDELESGKVPIEELGIPSTLVKTDPKGNPIHYRAAAYSNKYLDRDFGQGAKIKYYFVTNVKDKPPTNVVAFDVDEPVPKDIITIDLSEHIRRCFILPLKLIVEAIGMNMNDIVTNTITMTLTDFE
jgi:DNA polymerase I